MPLAIATPTTTTTTTTRSAHADAVHIERLDTGAYRLTTSLWLPRPRAEVFDFFSRAENLERITPGFLRFRILTPPPIVMALGTQIDYRLRLKGLPLRWRTQITAWDPPHTFTDTQRRGPYRQWVHRHSFADESGGTRCDDEVRYRVGGGALIHRLFVDRDVRAIFEFRQRAMIALLG